MASTSTNKQPLLGDRPFCVTKDLKDRFVGDDSNGIVVGANSAIDILDCTQNDGALVDSAAAITRAESGQGYEVFFYLSVANDFLRPSQAEFIGNWIAEDKDADGNGISPVDALLRVEYSDFPEILRPVPKVGAKNADGEQVAGTYYRGLYVPKGKCLWAACKKRSPNDDTANAPAVQIQGVFF